MTKPKRIEMCKLHGCQNPAASKTSQYCCKEHANIGRMRQDRRPEPAMHLVERYLDLVVAEETAMPWEKHRD